MNIKLILILVISSFVVLNINAQNFEWANSMGGTAFDTGDGIAIDDLGNVYSTGYFEGTVDFDPGAGIYNLTSAGNKDIYVTKFNSNGDFVWAKSFGGIGYDNVNAIALDNSGNIYTTGFFRETADFDPGSGTFNLTAVGTKDIYISKLDSNGDFVWAKSIGSADDEQGNDITVDGSGNVYTTGFFRGTVNFDPGAGTENLTSSGQNDVFVSKLDINGDFVWAKSFGGTAVDGGNAITLDDSDNVYTTGSYRGAVDFDPGAGIFNLTAEGYTDIYISKLDVNGDFEWAKSMGGTSNDSGWDIAIDNSGNIHTVGLYIGTSDFDPGASDYELTAEGDNDIFISKLDDAGNFIWAKSIGGSSYEYCYSLALDDIGNVYTTGHYKSTIDVDPGTGSYYMGTSSLQDYEVFILKLDASGNFVWANNIGYSDDESATDIALDNSNNVHIIGKYAGTVDFDPGTGTYSLTSEGSADAYVLKLNQCVNTTSTINPIVCNSYTVPSGDETYTTNGTYMDTIPNAEGCDSVITIDLTVNYDETGTDILTACDSYTWIDGNSYTSSNNTATHTLTTVEGCDSVVTLDLTIFNSTSSTDVLTACDSYTWIDGNTYTSSNNTAVDTITNVAGCDSIVTLDLTILNSTTSTDVITACDNYTWIDGNSYTSSNNTATDTLTNVAGCDSIITLDLTINTVDVSVTNNDPTLTSIATGASYQWINCNNNDSLISGETNQSFTPVENGSYAVIVSQNGCTDTSSCYAVVTVSLDMTKDNKSFIVAYPNPSTGVFNIEYNSAQKAVYILTDVHGKTIETGDLVNGKHQVFLNKQPNGIYFLHVAGSTLKLVKE
ncbi:MAG: SBBP repeat-containing protein [Brumimicrobium sp.]